MHFTIELAEKILPLANKLMLCSFKFSQQAIEHSCLRFPYINSMPE
ncbi:hypothetical protein [Microcoleus sp. K4-C2]